MILLEFRIQEGQFLDAFFMVYQMLKVSRQLNDFTHALQMYQIFADLLGKADQ
jgi:hypothetical protein